MIDRPPAVDLLLAMADTLQSSVVPACDGGPQHEARVVANLCRILAREWDQGTNGTDQTAHDLASFLGRTSDASLADLVGALDAQLTQAQPEGADNDALYALLAANVDRRLAVNKPTYHQPDGHGSL